MIGRSRALPVSATASACRPRPRTRTAMPLRTSRIYSSTDNDPEPNKDNAESKPGFGLDEFSPVELGRKSRQAFDDLWSQFATLASPTSSLSDSISFEDSFDVDPEASSTRVLVIGGAGRIGRVLVRKLLLRRYQVRVIIRNDSSVDEFVTTRVEVVIGDILDKAVCQEAMNGVDKVVFAAGSRSTDPEEHRAIYQQGLQNILHSFMDYKWVVSKKKIKGHKKTLASFEKMEAIRSWDAEVLGRVSRFEGELEDPLPSCSEVASARQWSLPQNSITIRQSKYGMLHFRGAVNDIGWAAEISTSVKREDISKTEGVILRVRGDGNIYAVVCTLEDGRKFTARFVTKWGYSTVRIPFTLFRPDWGGSDDLTGSKISKIGLRFENRGKNIPMSESENARPIGRYNLEVDWIKTLPTPTSTDFVLISCAGVPREGIELEDLQQILLSTRYGEAMVRNSGVGYTIIRPTTLIDEPGGLKALVFDQGDRLSQRISSVDVADVSVRSLPQPLASNKTFELAHEDTSLESGDAEYELVAHVPDKSTNYLSAALANLEKNT